MYFIVSIHFESGSSFWSAPLGASESSDSLALAEALLPATEVFGTLPRIY